MVKQTMVGKTAVSGKTVVAHRTPIIPAERKTAQRISLRCRCNVFAALFAEHELLGRYPRGESFQDRINTNGTPMVSMEKRKKIVGLQKMLLQNHWINLRRRSLGFKSLEFTTYPISAKYLDHQ